MTLIQFEDLGCSHCPEYMKDAFPTIINDYVKTGLVKVDFRGLGVVTRASAPALRYTLAASRQKKLWQVAELFYENQSRLNELATDAGVKRMVAGVKGLEREAARGRLEDPVREEAGRSPCGRGEPPQRAGHAVVLHQDRHRTTEGRPARGVRRRVVQRALDDALGR